MRRSDYRLTPIENIKLLLDKLLLRVLQRFYTLKRLQLQVSPAIG